MKRDNNKKRKKTEIAILILIAGILIISLFYWGYYGGKQAQKLSKICQIGIGEGKILCWKWRAASAEEVLQELFGDEGKDIGDSLLQNNLQKSG